MGWREEVEYAQRVECALEYAHARRSAGTERLERVVSDDMRLVEELLGAVGNCPELLLSKIDKTRGAFENGLFRHGSEVLIETIRREDPGFFGDLRTNQLVENSGIKTWAFELTRMLGMIVRAEFDQEDWLTQMTEQTVVLPDGRNLTVDGTLLAGRKLMDDSVGKQFVPSPGHPWCYISIDGCSTEVIEAIERRVLFPVELMDCIKAVVVYNAGMFADCLWTVSEMDGTFWLVVPMNNSRDDLTKTEENINLEQTITGYRHEIRHCSQMMIAPDLLAVPNYPLMEYDAITRQILDCNRKGLNSMAISLEADWGVYWNMLSGEDSSNADAHINSLVDREVIAAINKLASLRRTAGLKKYERVLRMAE